MIKPLIVAAIVAALGVSSCTQSPSSSLSVGLSSSGYGYSTPATPREELRYDPDDLTWMYKTVYGEVRRQPDHEIKAVCQVIYNRLQSGLYGSSFEEVVLAPKQFSVWNKRGGQRRYLLSGNVETDTDYQRVQTICNSVIQERSSGVDTSRGINYFYHPQSMEPSCVKYKRVWRHHRKHFKCTRWRKLPPRWAYNYHHRERIGAGVFFRKED
jgi:spore germination cell wall hydrolase CwlJ-like protein